MKSPPFDIGNTTQNSFGPLVSLESDSSELSKTAKATAVEKNMSS